VNWFCAPGLPHDLQLAGDEFKHCIKVLRYNSGDIVHLVDGNGNYYVARINEVHADRCQLTLERTDPENRRSYSIHLGVAPTKQNERMDWMLEKVVEIGVDSITFLECQRSERTHLKLERMQKIVVSAMKQSGQATLPALNSLVPFTTFIRECSASRKFIAHAHEQAPPHLFSLTEPHTSVAVLIGPEGDFAPAELDLALQHNFVLAGLGPNRLRTETAAWVACHSIHLRNV
jgi:16S rRNA (uracil1498-N3)-methyltransferase